MGWYSQTIDSDWRWEKEIREEEERIIKKHFGGDHKKYERYCDSQYRGDRRKSLQRRHLVKRFLTEFDYQLSEIESKYEIPIRQILESKLNFGFGVYVETYNPNNPTPLHLLVRQFPKS